MIYIKGRKIKSILNDFGSIYEKGKEEEVLILYLVDLNRHC